jgi:hypothetical protein
MQLSMLDGLGGEASAAVYRLTLLTSLAVGRR